jgi:hypothetical protein
MDKNAPLKSHTPKVEKIFKTGLNLATKYLYDDSGLIKIFEKVKRQNFDRPRDSEKLIVNGQKYSRHSEPRSSNDYG